MFNVSLRKRIRSCLFCVLLTFAGRVAIGQSNQMNPPIDDRFSLVGVISDASGDGIAILFDKVAKAKIFAKAGQIIPGARGMSLQFIDKKAALLSNGFEESLVVADIFAGEKTREKKDGVVQAPAVPKTPRRESNTEEDDFWPAMPDFNEIEELEQVRRGGESTSRAGSRRF